MAQPRRPHKLNRQTFHDQHDTLDPLQASHPRPVASRRNIQRQPSSREIRRQHVGGLLLDRPRSDNSTEEEARPSVRHHAHRRDRSQSAGLGRQISPPCLTIPKPKLNKVHYAAHIAQYTDSLYTAMRGIDEPANRLNSCAALHDSSGPRRAPWNSGRPIRLASWSPTTPRSRYGQSASAARSRVAGLTIGNTFDTAATLRFTERESRVEAQRGGGEA